MSNAPDRGADGTIVSLGQLLVAREQRASCQSAALARFGKPLVSATVVMPGPVKDGWLPRRALEIALQELDALASARGWLVVWREVRWHNTGPEAIYVLDVDPSQLKRATVEIENHHPLGRLWDLDVVVEGKGALSRKDLGFPVRRCLVCELPSHECGRSRRHPLAELRETIGKMVDEFDLFSPL